MPRGAAFDVAGPAELGVPELPPQPPAASAIHVAAHNGTATRAFLILPVLSRRPSDVSARD